MRPAVLQNGGDSLEDGTQAGKIVCAQYGRAVGGDAAVGVQDSLLAAGGRDGVHMGGQKDRRKRGVAGQIRIEIACISADLLRGVVLVQGDAEVRVQMLERIAQRALVQGGIVDGNERLKAAD